MAGRYRHQQRAVRAVQKLSGAPEMRNFRTLYFRRSGSLGQSQQDNSRAQRLYRTYPRKYFQINDIKGDLNIYFGGFSSQFMEHNLQSHSFLDTMYITLGRPVINLKPEGAKMMEEYMQLLIKMYEFLPEKIRPEIATNLYADIHKGISILYRNKTDEVHQLSKSELICRNFAQLVMQHYNQTRNVAWYAEKLQITHAHLCTTVKQITGKTCVDIISSMVIMDAKSQLKSSQLSIQNISDSLNFANVSFFGKYFKRYVGMSPLEYRNNG